MSSGSPFHNDTAWQPSPIHTPTPGHFNPLLNQLGTPGTPTPTDLRLNPAYNFHGSLFPNSYPFSNSLGTPPGTYHPYYYTPPASAAHAPYTLPLHDTRSTTLNAPSADNHPSQTAAPAKRGRKRKDPTQGGRASKRSKTAASAPGSSSSATPASAPPETPTSAASHCGVGPIDSTPAVSSAPPQPSLPPPLHSTDSRNSGRRDHSKTAATDVWYFLRALDTDLEPQVRPTNEPILECNPKTAFVGCKLCTYVLRSLKIVSHALSLSDLNPGPYNVSLLI
jgi:hypothetical protein